MPLFKSGRVWNPYAGDPSSTKRRRLEATEGLLNAVGLPEAAGFLEEAADLFQGDQFVPNVTSHPRLLDHPSLRDSGGRISSGRSSNRSKRGMPGRRRAWKGKRRKSEKARIFSQVMRMCDTKQIDFNLHEFSLAPGDATGTSLLVKAPYQAVAQGSGPMNYGQSKVFLRGIKIKATIMAIDPTNCIVELIFGRVKDQFDTTVNGTVLTNVGVTYNSTTTGVTNPTQTIPFSNIPFYDEGAAPFNGTSIITPINTDVVTVLKRRRWNFNTAGQEATHPLKIVNMWLPINKFWRINEVEEVADLPATSAQDGNYFYTWRVFGGEDETSSTALAQIKEDTTAFWKEF